MLSGAREWDCRCLGAEWRLGGRPAAQGTLPASPGSEGGIGGWESHPSPNDPGTDGRVAVPTSTNVSTPRRRDSGHSSTPKKARTSEDRYTGESSSCLTPAQGFYLVPAPPHPTVRCEDRSCLWQMRMPAAEMTLMKHFSANSPPTRVLRVMRHLLGEVRVRGAATISDYMLRTLLWHRLEERGSSGAALMRSWTHHTLASHVLVLLDNLLIALQHQNLPSYFFPCFNVQTNFFVGMLDRMNGASVFSILDLKVGYHQIRMHEADCEKTAFQFERSNYEFTRMPFGLKNAQTTFQRQMDAFLEGLDEGAIQLYMDHIIVFSRSEQEHGEHLVQFLRRLKEFGLKVSREKTKFFQPSVKFLGVGGLKETSARVARWKERLAACSFTISHNKGKDNVVADCLSRMVNALHAPTPSRGPSRRRCQINGSEDSPDVVDLPLLEHPEGESSIIPGLDLLRRRVVEEPVLPTVQVPALREIHSRSPEPDRRGVKRRVMTWLSDTLDDKARQLVVRIVSGDTVRSTFRKIGQNRVWELEIGSQAQNRDVCRITDELVGPGQTYYVYGDTTDGQKLITVLYETGLLAKGSVLTGVTKRLIIIEGEEEQRRLLRDYHVGKTNHRGVRETVSHLRRRYYWPKMTKMVAEELARCEMVTTTPEKPLDVVEADLVFLDGAIRLTLIDRLRFAYDYPLQSKTGKRVREGLLLFLATVGTPKTLVLDRGREFDNFLVRGLLEEFRVKVHWTTPGHSRSHEMIERSHVTLQEHLHILRIGRGMTGEEVWARALLAYNSSLHSATGYTPLELIRAWQREDSPVSIEYVCGELVDQDDRKKRDRVDRLNNKATDRWNRVQAGDYVFIKKIGTDDGRRIPGL
ncbi:hypothetical protein AAG570_009997 [Ranatra chinensis]|uniref:RNA-directed DNA polymerase n=1 Tax=Ranatra chinensis TaxID=642074 RepID=A0ABD0YQQ3_9HEMI